MSEEKEFIFQNSIEPENSEESRRASGNKNSGANFLKLFPRIFLSFVCSFLIFALLVVIVLKSTIFQASFMEKQADKVGYASQITKEINLQIENLGLGSNVPKGILNEVVSEDLVQKNLTYFFTTVYNGETFTYIESDQIKNDVIEKVNEYAKENNYESTEESKKGIETLGEEAMSIFETSVKLPYLPQFGKRILQYSSTIEMFMIVLGVSLILISILLIYLLKGWWHRLFRYLSYSFLGAGLMLIVAPASLLFLKTIDRIGVTTRSLYDFMTTYLNSTVWAFIYVGMISCLIGIFFAGLSVWLRKRLQTVKP